MSYCFPNLEILMNFKPKHNTTYVNVVIICVCNNLSTYGLSMKDKLPPMPMVFWGHSKRTLLNL